VRIRNTAQTIRLLRIALADPSFTKDDVVQTYQCHRRHPDGGTCNAIVDIKLGDWEPVEVG